MATIQIADNDARVQYTQAVVANTTQLTIDYPFFSLDDINVIVTNAAGTDTVLTRGTGTGTFAVVGVAVDDGFSGGYITLGDSYSAGTDTFTIFRDIPVERTTDFPTSGPFNISSLNTELDKIIAIEQELETKVTRTLQLADSDATVDLKLPNLDTRKGTTLAFNATTGVPEAGPTISGVNTVAALAADIATLADIEDGTVATDAISDTAAIAANVTTVAGISSNVSAVAGNASNINAVNANSSNINTVAGINANVTTVAGISSNVTTAAGISADITAVAADASDIGTVSANIANVNSVAAIDSDVTTVAGMSSADITTVAGISSNVTTVAGISSNVTTVAGIAADVTAAATNASDISAIAAEVAKVVTVANDLNEATSEIDVVANNIANVNLVGTDIANVNTVATNLTDINSFANTYFISATAPVSPTTGDLWFDTTASTMKVYDGSGFVNAGSSVNGTSARYSYTATASQTSFAATYDAGYVDVYLNGVKLVSGTDFTATDGSTVVLATGAALNDTVDIIGYGTFSVSSAVTLPDGVKASFGDSNDLQIYRDPSANVSWISNTVGDLYIRNDGGSGSSLSIQAKTNEDSIVCVQDFGVSLFYDNSLKLATTATGVDVTGTVTADGLTVDGNSKFGSSAVIPGFAGAKDISLENNVAIRGTNAGGTTAFELIKFNTSDQIVINNDGASAVLIPSGNVGIGTSPSQKLSILTSNGLLNIANGNTSNGTKVQSFVTAGNANGYLAFEGFDKEYARLDADGLKFNGDTAAANALDDYEEGTWTPVITAAGGTVFTSTIGSGRYTKIGNTVHCWGYSKITNVSGGTNIGGFSGLPFAGINDSFPAGNRSGIGIVREDQRTGILAQMFIQGGQPYGVIQSVSGGNMLTPSTNDTFLFEVTYKTNA